MKLFPRSFLFATAAFIALPAYAQNGPGGAYTIYNNNGASDFNTASNFNNGAPGAGITVYAVPNGQGNPDGSFTVIEGGPTNIVLTSSISQSAANFVVSNDIGNGLAIGTVTLTFASGTTFTVANDVTVRDAETLTFNGNLDVGGGVNVGVNGGGSFTMASGILNNSGGSGIFVGEGATNTGTFTQSAGSSVISGAVVDIENGSYTLNGNSLLTTSGGTLVTVGGAGAGTLTLNDTSTVTLVNGTTARVGTIAGKAGVITQAGATSVFNVEGNSAVSLGTITGGSGTYNLQGGALNIGTTAGDTASFTVGGVTGATGTLNQSGGTLTTLAGTTFTVGAAGTGVYNMTGGTATFGGGLTVGAHGTLNLNDGTVSVAEDGITGAGTINFGGGTLALTAGADTDKTFSFPGTLTGGTSTIDASASGLNSLTFANALVGNGMSTAGLNLIGDGTTIFKFASTNGGTANTYTGSTSISGGTLDATAADLGGKDPDTTLTIGANSAINLSTGTGVPVAINSAVLGTGTLNVNFGAANQTLALTSTANANSSVNIVLGAATYPGATATTGTLSVLSGSFGTISDNGTASSVIVGDGTTAGAVTFGDATYTGTTTVNTNASLTSSRLESTETDNNGTLIVSGQIGLTGADTVTNGSTNASAVLQAGNITGSVNNMGGTVTITGSPIPGTPGIGGNVDNAGNLTDLFGIGGNVNTNSGTLTINSVTGSILNNTGVIDSGLTSNTLPAVQTTTVAIGGLLDSSGTLDVHTNGVTSDLYTVTGGVSTVGGTAHFIGFGNLTDHVFLHSPNGLDSTGLTATFGGSGLLFTGTITQVGNDEEVTTIQQTTGSVFAQTPNQHAVANAIDPFLSGTRTSPNFNFLGNALNNIPTTSAGAAALEQLSPESLQYARNIANDSATYLALRMNAIDADLRNGNDGLDSNAVSVTSPGFQSGMGRSLRSLAYNDPGFHNTAPNGVNYYPGEAGRSSPSPSAISNSPEPATFDSSSQVISDSPNPYLADVHPGGPETPGLNEFIGGDVVLADLNKDSSNANAPSSKASYTAGDVTAGVSYRVTNHFAAGVLFDYNHTDADTDSSGSKTKVDSYSPGIFATYFDKGFYANGLFSFGYNTYSNDRNTGFGTAHSSPDGQQYVGDLDAGYDFHPAKNWIVGPSLGLTYTHLDIDSFTETGAASSGTDLSVQDQSADSLRSRLGGHLVYQTNTGDVLLQPNFTAMWQHEFLADSSGITSSFSDFGSDPFTINTAAPTRDSALIGLGLTATLNNSMALYLNYLANVGGSDYFSQTVYGGFKARF